MRKLQMTAYPVRFEMFTNSWLDNWFGLMYFYQLVTRWWNSDGVGRHGSGGNGGDGGGGQGEESGR